MNCWRVKFWQKSFRLFKFERCHKQVQQTDKSKVRKREVKVLWIGWHLWNATRIEKILADSQIWTWPSKIIFLDSIFFQWNQNDWWFVKQWKNCSVGFRKKKSFFLSFLPFYHSELMKWKYFRRIGYLSCLFMLLSSMSTSMLCLLICTLVSNLCSICYSD